MPEERGLYPKMRVREQLVYFARLHGLGRRGRRTAADRWIERLGLGERAADKVETLSLGNQQRVQLGVRSSTTRRCSCSTSRSPGSTRRRRRDERRARGARRGGRAGGLLLPPARARRAAVRGRGDRQRTAGWSRPARSRSCASAAAARSSRSASGVEGDGDGGWIAGVPGAELAGGGAARAARPARRRRDRRAARRRPRRRHRHPLQRRAAHARRPLPPGGGGMSGREAVGLVARREIAERVREKSFLYST